MNALFDSRELIVKIVFLGNSLTEGAYGGNWVRILAQRHPEHTLINAGVGGDTVYNLSARLETDVLAHEPDGVFVMGGGNDAISYAQPETRKYYRRSKAVPEGIVTPEAFTQLYRDMLTRIQLAHALVWVGLAPSEYNPAVVAALKQYNELTMQSCRALNIPVLDLMAHFTPDQVAERPPLNMDYVRLIGQRVAAKWRDYEAEQVRGGFSYTFDGVHITAKTAERFADLIGAFIGLS